MRGAAGSDERRCGSGGGGVLASAAQEMLVAIDLARILFWVCGESIWGAI
uniref:Uncharacterized protein n=1 Tax=Arundo donax TaxID=35708 RepID=A0A0A8YV38_ARUDO